MWVHPVEHGFCNDLSASFVTQRCRRTAGAASGPNRSTPQFAALQYAVGCCVTSAWTTSLLACRTTKKTRSVWDKPFGQRKRRKPKYPMLGALGALANRGLGPGCARRPAAISRAVDRHGTTVVPQFRAPVESAKYCPWL
jgi:hypothetical protein